MIVSAAEIENRSRSLRDDYLAMIDDLGTNPVDRTRLSCGNLAHGFAACSSEEKSVIKMMVSVPSVLIFSMRPQWIS